MLRITVADILKVVPITRKTLWLWQKKYRFFLDPLKEGHPVYCRNCLRWMSSGQKGSSVSTRDYDSRYNASRHQWPGGLQSPLSEDKTKNIKIIAISGDLRFTKTEVIGAGANSFFTKPVNFENLLSLCNEFLEEPETLK